MSNAEDVCKHPADGHFVSLLTYLNHLVRCHGIEENQNLWRSEREQFDQLHRAAHTDGTGAVIHE